VGQPGGAVDQDEQRPWVDAAPPELIGRAERDVAGVDEREDHTRAADRDPGHLDALGARHVGRHLDQSGHTTDAVVVQHPLERRMARRRRSGSQVDDRPAEGPVGRLPPGLQAEGVELPDERLADPGEQGGVLFVRGAVQHGQLRAADQGAARAPAVRHEHRDGLRRQPAEARGQVVDGARGDVGHGHPGIGQRPERPGGPFGERRRVAPQQDALEPPGQLARHPGRAVTAGGS